MKPKRKAPLRLVLVLALLLAGGLFFYVQQNWLQPEAFTVADGSLPTPFEGLRIVHLSDSHGKEFGPGNAKLLELVAAQEPDLIAITGDLIDRAAQLDMVAPLASGLAAIAPTYYVTGNHEWAVGGVGDLKELLRNCGVTVLSNQYATLEREGQTIVIAGVDDPNGLLGQKTAPELYAEIEADLGDPYTVLLTHRDTVEVYGRWRYDLVLCGHGHGGIIRIPIIDKGLLSTDRQFFPKYDGGLYQIENGGWCMVSRGLGSNTTPIRAFRLFNRPHVPVLTLTQGG